MAEESVFSFLYKLASRAPRLSADAFLKRLVTGVANHYDAVGCAIHADASGWAAAAADPAPMVEELSTLDRARLETIEARIVKDAVDRGQMVSALDLEGEEEVEAFLTAALGIVDIFGFPLKQDESVFAVVVIYLGPDSLPFRDPDMYAMYSLAQLVVLAGHTDPADAADA